MDAFNPDSQLDPASGLPRACAACAYTEKKQISPSDIQRHLFCYRFPPGIVAVPSPHGLQMNAMHIPVQPGEWCYEFKAKTPKLAVS